MKKANQPTHVEALESATQAFATSPEHGPLLAMLRTLAVRLDALGSAACPECGSGLFDEATVREFRQGLALLYKEAGDGHSPEGPSFIENIRSTPV